MNKIIRYDIIKDGQIQGEYPAETGFDKVLATAKKNYTTPFEVHPIEEDEICYNPIIVEK